METTSVAVMILVASLAGSGHCVGMCGPLALLAAPDSGKSSGIVALSSYHLGRLLTYLILGLAAAVSGSLVDLGGSILGWQRLAAWVAGSAMIVYGVGTLTKLSLGGSLHVGLPRRLGRFVQRLYRSSGHLSGLSRSFAIGGITAWLPCGWLYAFVLVALGTSNPVAGPAVMFLFWLGTLPLLSAFVLGARQIPIRWRQWIPQATAILLILSGVFTISVRANAMFDSLETTMRQQATTVDAISTAAETPLPCCHPTPAGE